MSFDIARFIILIPQGIRSKRAGRLPSPFNCAELDARLDNFDAKVYNT